jgi:hypothetical protein
MARSDLNSPEWFTREKFALIEHLKALDGFSEAMNSFQKLVELGGTAATEVRAALHTASVIYYARPFITDKYKFSKKIIKKHPDYDEGIHGHLLHLRNRLIAHSDRDYADGRLFRKLLNVSNNVAGDQFDRILLGMPGYSNSARARGPDVSRPVPDPCQGRRFGGAYRPRQTFGGIRQSRSTISCGTRSCCYD